MDEFTFVPVSELSYKVSGRATQQGRHFLRVVVDQSSRDRDTTTVDEINRFAGDEGAVYADHTSGEQRGAASRHSSDRPVVEHELSLGLGGVGQPQQPSRPTTTGRREPGTALGARENLLGLVSAGHHRRDSCSVRDPGRLELGRHTAGSE